MKGLFNFKLDTNNMITVVIVVLIAFFGLSMVINATGTGLQKLNTESEDPAFNVSLGNKMMPSGGDFVGSYSANLTGGIKINYPWPLKDGPGANLDLSA